MVEESEYKKNLRALGILNIISIVAAPIAVGVWLLVIEMMIVIPIAGTEATPLWGKLLDLIPILAVPAFYIYSIVFSIKHNDEDNWKFTLITSIIALVAFIIVSVVALVTLIAMS